MEIWLASFRPRLSPSWDYNLFTSRLLTSFITSSIFFRHHLLLSYEDDVLFPCWALSFIAFITATRLPSTPIVSVLGLFVWASFYFIFKLFSTQWFVFLTSTLSSFGAGLVVRRRYPSSIGWLAGSFYFGILYPAFIQQTEYLTIPPALVLVFLCSDRPGLQPFFAGGSEIAGSVLVYPLTHAREVGWLSFTLGLGVGIAGRRVPKQRYVSPGLSVIVVALFWLVEGDENEAAYFSALGALFALTSRGLVWSPCVMIGVGWLIPVHWIGSAVMAALLLVSQFAIMGQSLTLAERCKEKGDETTTQMRRVLRVWKLRSTERLRLLALADESHGELRMTYLTRAALLEQEMNFLSSQYDKLQALRHRFEQMQYAAENAQSVDSELVITRELEQVLKTSALHECEIEARQVIPEHGFEVNMETVLSQRLERLNLARDFPQSQDQYEFV